MPFGDRIRNKMAEKAQQATEPAPTATDAPAAAAPPAPATAPPAVDPMERLRDLGQLHEQGILTDEEFAAENAKILNG